MQTPQGWYNALRVVKKNIWMFLLLLIQNCAIWLMAENRFVLSFTYTKLILFLLPCNLFVCGSFELYPNGKFTKKKLRDVRIFQVFTWAPFRLWWLMSLPTYKNIDIRYINKMFFFAMPGYILQLMGCYLADLVDYGSKSWILGCMSEYMSVRCASHLGKDARPCWKLKQKMFENRNMKNRFWLFLDILDMQELLARVYLHVLVSPETRTCRYILAGHPDMFLTIFVLHTYWAIHSRTIQTEADMWEPLAETYLHVSNPKNKWKPNFWK